MSKPAPAKGNKPVKKKLRVDFTGVETRANVEDGEYLAEVDEATLEESSSGNDYIKWVFKLLDEQVAGRKVFYNTSLLPQALWNLRSLLNAFGVETTDGEMDLDLTGYKGLRLKIQIVSEVYDGKTRPKVTDFSPVTDVADAEDDEKKEEAEEEEETEEEEGEEEEAEEEEKLLSEAEVREMDDKELADLVKTHGLKVDLSKFPKKSKRIAAVVDAMEVKGLLAPESE